MSLNYDLTAIPDFKDVCYVTSQKKPADAANGYWGKDEEGTWFRLDYHLNTLILVSPAIGMGELTEENIDEWLRRIQVLEVINGAWNRGLTPDGDLIDVYMTKERLMKWLGLRLNIKTETARQWNARMKPSVWGYFASEHTRRDNG